MPQFVIQVNCEEAVKILTCAYGANTSDGLDGPFLRVQVREAVVTVLLAAILFLDIV